MTTMRFAFYGVSMLSVLGALMTPVRAESMLHHKRLMIEHHEKMMHHKGMMEHHRRMMDTYRHRHVG